MECSATAEVLCGCGCAPACAYLVRVHPHPAAVLNDPWFWSVAVRRDGDHAILVGGEGDPARDGYPAFLDKLRELGFVGRRWCRVKDGVKVWHERRL